MTLDWSSAKVVLLLHCLQKHTAPRYMSYCIESRIFRAFLCY